MNDLDMETTVVAIVAPTMSVWAVFASEEGNDEEIWTERVHLWAHTRTAFTQDIAAQKQVIGEEVLPPRYEIKGMILCEDDVVLVDETEGLFLGYSENEKPCPEDWRGTINRKRSRFARQMAELGGEGAARSSAQK